MITSLLQHGLKGSVLFVSDFAVKVFPSAHPIILAKLSHIDVILFITIFI